MQKKLKKVIEKVKQFYRWFVKRNLRTKLIIVAVVVGLLWFGYKKVSANSQNQTQIQTAIVEKGNIVSTISASGTVVSANSFTVKTSASGVVTKVYVKDGDEVVKGQKIAEIELDLDGEQQYAQALSSYISASNQLKSAQNSLRLATASINNVYDQIQGHDSDETFAMIETRTRAEVSYDNAYNSLSGAQASLTNADFNLKANSPTIVAPNSGTIQGLTIAEGLPLSAQTTSTGTRTGQRIATIVKEGNPLISVDLSEIDVPSVEVGQKATIIFDSISDKTFTGVVTAIDRTGSTTSNVTSYPAIITLDSGSDQILANMAVTANIITTVSNDVLLIPSTALEQQGDQYYVVVMKVGNRENLTVEIGISSDSQVEILSGLSEGDEVITGTVSTEYASSQENSVFSSGFGTGRMMPR